MLYRGKILSSKSKETAIFQYHGKINGRTFEQPLTSLRLYMVNRVTVTKNKPLLKYRLSSLIVKFVKQKLRYSHALFTPHLLNYVGIFY